MLKPCKQKRVMSRQDLKPHRKPRIRDHIWGREKEEYKADQIRRMNVKKIFGQRTYCQAINRKVLLKFPSKSTLQLSRAEHFLSFLLFLFTKRSKLNKTKTSLQSSAKQQQVYVNKWYAAYLKDVHWTKREKKKLCTHSFCTSGHRVFWCKISSVGGSENNKKVKKTQKVNLQPFSLCQGNCKTLCKLRDL